MIEDIGAVFEKYNDDYLAFAGVKNKRSKRADLHAFLKLEELVPGNADIISSAEHDEVYLGVDVSKLAKAASEDDILELVRCGVRYDAHFESLCMFV